ncbi:hypothetical protein PATSB16_32790 [Pandoraea thiooxydans]|nr:hypothetical protein PATSB16_32790 [Pandoraea thiooxydans]
MLPNCQNRDKSKAILGLNAALLAHVNHKNKWDACSYSHFSDYQYFHQSRNTWCITWLFEYLTPRFT